MTNSAETHIDLGIDAQQAGQWKQALRHYDDAVEAEPNDALAHQLRGALYLELKRYYDALRDFDRAIVLAPYNEIGYFGKAQVFVGLKDYRWAVIQFTNAIDLLPDDAPEIVEFYRERANAYQLMGDRNSAERDRQHAQTIEQNFA